MERFLWDSPITVIMGIGDFNLTHWNIINDREVGGRYYCFVTFTNPQSAVDAIKNMDGRKVEGRILRVNEVKSRGGRSNFSRDNFRHNINRDLELDKGRDRDRDYGRVRDRSRDQNSEWSGDRDQGKERGYDRARDIDRTGERFINRDREHDRDKDMNTIESEGDRDQTDKDYRSGNKHKDETTRDQNREWSRDRDQGHENVSLTGKGDMIKIKIWIALNRDRDRIDRDQRSGNKYKDESAKLTNGSDFSERHSREHPSASSHGDHDQRDRDRIDRDQRSGNKYKDESAKLTNGSDFSERHSREHPSASSHGDHDQVFRMEELVKERGDHVSKLQEKSQKLEDALASAKKLTSNRKKQLSKLHKCFLNMKEYGEKLRSSEEELQKGQTKNWLKMKCVNAGQMLLICIQMLTVS
ncbi:hypothetical protein CTI12_AA218710 [Artemisia annua]|uniref:RRM domain-containing protein n=1 Tax=Artemisia annua TaxID=35608 RepID=A0A2U1NX18_ARTAN|nr:hypothetical protein CTI12_AA218710 [Artemisia annua]